jgi:hypothetical protein
MPHLWEIEHAYYCNEGNYYASGAEKLGNHFKSWAAFAAEFGDADMDYNLLFRFDWVEGEDEGAEDFNGDVNYRNGHFKVFWMGQRKGLYRWDVVEVCRADEPAVIAFLRPRWEHLRGLWAPLSTELAAPLTA